MLLAEQLRAARTLLQWTQEELSQRAEVGLSTIKRIEAKSGPVLGNAATIWKLQRTLEDNGIVFIEGDRTAGPGVRLAEPYGLKGPKS